MSGPQTDQIVQKLLAMGVTPTQIAEVNPIIGRRVQAGLIAPRLEAPDKIAERGAYIRDYGQINKDRDDLAKVYPMTADLDRFHALNVKQPTGGIDKQDYDGWERANPLNWPGMVGHAFSQHDPEVKELSGIASGLQGKARPVGSGATSDFEQRLYRMGVPSPEKQGPTNDSIINYQKGVMAEQSDRLAFQEEFLRRNGSLSGSQQAWGRYVNDNPYTVSGEGGRSVLNARRTDWKGHFGLEAAEPARPAAQGKTKPPGWTAELPRAQRNAARMFGGAKAPGGTKGNPFVPTSAAEFSKLPPGSWYLDDDGRSYEKGGR
jgi:hypothetical protein